ncbi:MAG: ComEC/Rec2 family competence protein [Anaerolineae bacterium]|nr:ComEC/Rec2 family competence protein [Anaerolineae bacterium]
MILILLVAGWVIGIVLAASLELPTAVWLLLSAIPLGYLLLFWKDERLRLWHFVLIFLVLGALRFQLALPGEPELELAQFNEQGRASLVGVVVDEPDVRQTQTLVKVRVSKIQTAGQWRDTGGLALVSAPRDTAVRYGDEVQVDGAPTTPPDGADFSYRDYLAREHVFTLVRYARLYTITGGRGDSFFAAVYAFKAEAKRAIAQLLPEPSAALLTGILLGDDRGLPDALAQAFADTNTAHVIAISGFNIAVLIGVLVYVVRRPADAIYARVLIAGQTGAPLQISGFAARHLTTVIIVAMLVLYTLLVGASASVVRACIMGALVLIALEFGRVNWAINALAIAAFVMTLLNPYVLWDLGFQLSFLATLGLLIYVPRIQARMESSLTTRMEPRRAQRIVYLLGDTFIVTLAAFLVTAPLLIVYFHRVSPIGFLTNFLILPAQPAIMVFGGAATLLQMLANALAPIPIIGLIVGALAQGIGWGAFVFLQYTISVVEGTAAVPYGSFAVERVDMTAALLFYAALAAVTWLGVRRALGMMFSHIWIPIALLATGVVFVWASAVAWSDGRTRVIFVGASQGDATFVRTGDDYRILINGTGEPNTLLSFLGNQLPPWDRRLDLVVATHLDNDNLSSLNAVLERYDVGQVLEPSAPARPGVSFEKWRELVETRGLSAHEAAPGMTLRAGAAELEVVLGTKDERPTTNTVLRIDTEGTTFLMAPRLTASEQKELLESAVVLDADVAVLPNDVEKEFLERVTPETVILFVGQRPQDKPTGVTLKLLEGVTVLRTDERGTITSILDGASVTLRAER